MTINHPLDRRVLILGASGMLGNALFRFFSQSNGYKTFGTVRSDAAKGFFPKVLQANMIAGVEVDNIDHLTTLFATVKPHIVINCVGLVKQLAQSEDPLLAIPINAILPHKLAKFCSMIDARFIHISTDCVFSGSKGMYSEQDTPDAIDVYGRSKLLGEVDYPNAVTLRTSIIGHELTQSRSLIGWFLSQTGQVKGYSRAIFSGLPTVELARVIRDYVLKDDSLRGLYHVSAAPINKYDLLSLVSKYYDHAIDIIDDDTLIIDRSLNSTRFKSATNYRPPAWPELVKLMNDFQ
jgi:dTDP-4-dehydrorhamnose reductase